MTPPAPPSQSSYDAVVIGSGHNGLIAAAYLAAAGKSVLVLEKESIPGGATTSQRVFPDFDARLSRYSYLVSLLPRKIVADLRLDFTTRRRSTASFTPWTDEAGRSRGLVLSNVDPERSRASMREVAGSDREWQNHQRFTELTSALAAVAWPSFLQPLRTRRDFINSLGTDLERTAWEAFVERPLGEAIERGFETDIMRGLVMTDAKIGVFTHPHDPSLIQNRCFLYHVTGNGTGEWQVPVGGMGALVAALLDRCQAGGVELLTGSPAIHIEPGRDEQVVTYEAEGVQRHVRARHVLVNAGPRCFASLLDLAWEPDAGDEGSVIKINMLLKRLPKVRAEGVTPEEAFGGTFHIDEGYAQMLDTWRQASTGALPDPAPGEIYCHTLTDPSILSPELREAGYHTLTLFGLDMPYRLFKADHAVARAEALRLYLRGLDRICAEPFEDCLARDGNGKPCVEIKSPVDLEREIGLDQGNIFHNAPGWFFTDNPDQAGTWGVETDFPGIHLAGSSALRGGAVSGIPGHNAAMRVLGLG